MYIALSIVIVIACVLLTLVVLAQNSKGGGLAANFGAGNQTFGVRQTADLLEKLTWILAGVILVLSVACSFFTADRNSTSIDVTKKIEAATNTAAPAFPSTFDATGDAPSTEAVPAEAAAGEEAPEADAQ